jgi:hypothetical protein
MALLGNVALTGRDVAVDHVQHVLKGLGHLLCSIKQAGAHKMVSQPPTPGAEPLPVMYEDAPC